MIVFEYQDPANGLDLLIAGPYHGLHLWRVSQPNMPTRHGTGENPRHAARLIEEALEAMEQPICKALKAVRQAGTCKKNEQVVSRETSCETEEQED